MKKFKEDYEVKKVFDEILMPVARMFVNIEEQGVYIDLSKMADVEGYLRRIIHKAKKKLNVYRKIDPFKPKKKMNWGSTKQLGYVLFEEFGLTPLDKTKKGKNSTSESVLLRLDHPIVEDLLKFRGANQQLSFFIEGWKPFLDGRRLHPNFKLHGTVTGRLSCEKPNLQQVPRDPRIRTLITSPRGWVLVAIDLSQIELRIAAELANEKNMLEAFHKGEDVHWKTAIREISRSAGMAELVKLTAEKHTNTKKINYGDAIQVLLEIGHVKSIEIDKRWKEVRKRAKSVNFGYLYKMWWKQYIIYARDKFGVKVTEEQAKQSREAFFELYPAFKAWHKRQEDYARMFGYVKSLSGRKRRLPDAMLSTAEFHVFAQAINSPVQSFANELNLMAALEFEDTFDRSDLRIVSTNHDEVLAEVRHNKVRRIVPEMIDIMSHPKLLDKLDIRLKVPIVAEASIGPWGAGKELSEWVNSE